MAARLTWPLPNVWLGVSCEDQAAADERIPLLLQCQAAVRWVSAEPLLGPIDFDLEHDCAICEPGEARRPDWIVVGGESGHDARPFDMAWARDIQRQCREAGCAYFFKQAGSATVDSDRRCGMLAEHDRRSIARAKALGSGDNPPNLVLFRDRAGADPSEWPDDMRVQQWPEVGP